jgi:hypothetical protein
MASSRNNALEFSSAGSEILGAGDSVTAKRYGAIQLVTDTNFSVLTANNVDQLGAVLTGVGIGAGTILYGQFSAVAVTSGLVICHKY